MSVPKKLRTTGKLCYQLKIAKPMKVTRLSQDSKYLLQSPGSSQHLSLPPSTLNSPAPVLHSASLASPNSVLDSLGPLSVFLVLVLLVHLPLRIFSLVTLSLLFLSRSDPLSSHNLVYFPGLVHSELFQMPPAVLSLISAIKTSSSTISRSSCILIFILIAPEE